MSTPRQLGLVGLVVVALGFPFVVRSDEATGRLLYQLLFGAFLVAHVRSLANGARWVLARSRAGAMLLPLAGDGWRWGWMTPSKPQACLPLLADLGMGAAMTLCILSLWAEHVATEGLLMNVGVLLMLASVGLSILVPTFGEPWGRAAHERGIVAFPFVVPWPDIMAYDWSEEAEETKLTLRTRRRQRLFSGSVSVGVSPDRKAALEALLRQRGSQGTA